MPLYSNLFRGDERLQSAANNPAVPIAVRESDPHAVGLLQFALTKLGYGFPISTTRYGLDGKFGQETQRAVKSFQRQAGLTADGLAGPKTLGKLDAILATMPQGGATGPYPVADARSSITSPITRSVGARLSPQTLLSFGLPANVVAEISVPAGPPTLAGVTFAGFRNTGTGRLGNALGPADVFTYFQNAVELAFSIGADVRQTHAKLQPRQWAGPEATWVMDSDPPIGPWKQIGKNAGSGSDDPLPQNQKDFGNEIVYFDSPGPNVAKHSGAGSRVFRMYTVQNFTGWIGGTPRGKADEVLVGPVAAWYTTMHLFVANWFMRKPDEPNAWQRASHGCGSGEGWADAINPIRAVP